MADLLEKLWPAFVSEVTEQLDSVELLLAKSGAAASVDVNHLFRNFHTIKGNCSMIGFTSMEVIAHRSEDILAAVRNQDIAMSDDVIDILLESIACLKKQFQSANSSRENPQQDDVLVNKLSSFVESHTDQVSADTATAGQADMEALVLAARMAVPVMVLGLDPAAKVDQVEAAVAGMAGKAQQCGFRALAGALRHFIATLKADIEEKPRQLLEQLAEIFDDIGFICQEHKIDLNLDMGAKLCRSKLSVAYKDELQQLTALLQSLKETEVSNWQVDQFLAIVEHSSQLSSYSSLFTLHELNLGWRYIKQLVVEVSRGYLVFNQLIIDKLLDIVDLAQSKEALAGGDEPFEKTCKKAREELQTLTAKHNNERDEIVTLKEQITGKTTLCFDSLVDLKIDVLEKINQAIDAGKLAVEIDIDFSDEVVSEKVLMAVRNLGELAHSRTMFHDIVNGVAQRTSFSFLILSDKTVEDIDKILSIIDRERKSFIILGFEHLFSAAGKSPATEQPAPAPQEPPPAPMDDGSETENLVSETAMSLGSLKVDGSAIDRVIRDIGELITHHNRLSHLITQDDFALQLTQLKNLLHDKGEQGKQSLQFLEHLHGQLVNSNESLQVSLSRIQDSVLDLRVVPISYAFNRFHKFVRTIAQKLNKKVVLDVIGEQVKVDKGMIDVLSEPLAHMVRNSIDHGIETPAQRKEAGKEEFGLIRLAAIQQSNMVVIEISDDGAGLNRQRILDKCIRLGMLKEGVNYSDQEVFKYIFEPGFSTSETLTETSGRGVGMDVVKSRIVEVGGTVSVQSTAGKGTTIQLKLPVSAAIQSVILIDNNGQTLALPERHVTEIVSIHASDLQVIQDQSAIMLRDNIVPIYRLADLISNAPAVPAFNEENLEVVVIANDQFMIGLVVDAALGRAEVLVRDVHDSLRHMAGVSGAALLGDGKVVIILDCGGLFDLAVANAQNILGMSAAG
ncbi:MAG TPA: ATP-binding protein [Pseudomonadales bacterium]